MKKKIVGFMVIVLCFISLSFTALAADSAMKNKKWVSGEGGVYEKDEEGDISYKSYGTSYYKIKIPKQGYIIVDVKTSSLPGEKDYYAQDEEFDEEDSSFTNVSLLNASKKVLVENSNILNEKKNFSFSWAVKKGTYYLAADGDQQYKIRYSFTAVGKLSKAGKNLKSAVTLKKGATVKNLISLDKDHYYKIKLSKNAKAVFSFDSKIKSTGLTDGGLFMQAMVKKGGKYRVIDEKGKLIPKDNSFWWEIEGKDKVTLNLPKGTYYIRIGTYTHSGYYTLKWK